MKEKKLSILYILLGICSMLTIQSGCGNSVENDQGEGFVFDTIPVFPKDTFLYPLSTRSSGYMFPEVNFGDVKTIDGDLGTGWYTIPGLVTGEYIEFDFDSLYIAGFETFTSTDIRFSRIKNLKVYAEGKLIGIFSPDTRAPIGRKVNNLRIELGETDGTNKVDIPFETDSTRNILTDNLSMESIYASKSAAIFEFVFFDEKGVGIPIRSMHVKKAKMNFYGVAAPIQMNNARLLFDGRKSFGWKGTTDSKDKTLLFSFEQDQIINGVYFPFVENLNVTKFGFRLRKRDLPEYDVAYKSGNGIYIPLKNALKGKNFEMVILKTKNNEAPYIPELLFSDGSRYFSIYSDSLQFYQQQRKDSAQNTAMMDYLDSRIVSRNGWKEYAHPINQIFAAKKTVTDTLPTKTVQVEVIYRLSSNGNFLLTETRTEQSFGVEPFTRTHIKHADGYWTLKTKSKDQVTVSCFSDLKDSETIARPGKENYERTTVKSVTFEATMVKKQVSFSNYFSNMITGY